MAILNYTTTVAVEKTLAEIQRILGRGGARSITVDYDDNGVAEAVGFLVRTEFGERYYALPASIDKVYAVLQKQWNVGKVPRRFVSREQAARVGWRIVKDWLEAQMAIIEAGLVTLDQVLLPYMDTGDGRTVYQVYVENRATLPPPK